MSVLKFNTATNKFNHGKVDISDCSFTLPTLALPCTLATAFIDATYPNIAPYFADYATGAAWVEAQITAGADVGNLIITSSQTDCELISNVNIWIAPNVTLANVTGANIHDVYIDGQGYITDFAIMSCSAINLTARYIGAIRLNSSSYVKVAYNECPSTTIYLGSNIDLVCNGNGGSLSVNGEALVDVTGCNAHFDSISVINDSSLRGRNFRVLGLTSFDGSSEGDFQGCEFWNTSGYGIDSLGEISLTNCWINSSNYGIRMNYNQKGVNSLILNNTIIKAGGAYSVYDGNTAGLTGQVYIYGGSCANRNMYNCSAYVQSLTVNTDLKYRAY